MSLDDASRLLNLGEKTAQKNPKRFCHFPIPCQACLPRRQGGQETEQRGCKTAANRKSQIAYRMVFCGAFETCSSSQNRRVGKGGFSLPLPQGDDVTDWQDEMMR